MDEGTTDVDVVRAVVEEMLLHLPTEKRGEARARLYAVWTVYKGMSEAEWRGKMAERGRRSALNRGWTEGVGCAGGS